MFNPYYSMSAQQVATANGKASIDKIVLPPNATADTPMSVEATDGNEKPLESATFEFVGCKVRISGGKGTLLYGDFVKGMGETAVWMFRPGRTPVPGGLTFG